MTRNILAIVFVCGIVQITSSQTVKSEVPTAVLAKGILKIDDPVLHSEGIFANNGESVIIGKRRNARQAAQDPQNDVEDNSFKFSNVNLPKLIDIQADCINPQFIKVSLAFDQIFNGIIYTKGHYNDDTCAFAKEETGVEKFNFTIPTDLCGSLNNQAEANESITEATIIVQNDPLFQDVNDVARRIRCAWSDRFDKIISSHGFKVGSLNENTMDYSADAVSVWMDLRMGKDPYSGTPVTNGVVRLGSDMTIAVYIKSKIEKGLDVVIRDCVANDAKKHQQIQLTDENGCVVQKKLMTPFIITDRVGQSGASRVAYAMLKSFKFPDSLDVNIMCNVAMCKGPCGISCVEGHAGPKLTKTGSSEKPTVKATVDSLREKREAKDTNSMDDSMLGKTVFLKESESTEVVLERGIRVLSDNDITEVLVGNPNKTYDVTATMIKNSDYICIPKTGFAVGLALLLLLILILTIITVFLVCAACVRRQKKVAKNSQINLYNSSEHLIKTSLPTVSHSSLPHGSLPNISMNPNHVNGIGSFLTSSRGSQGSDFKASSITLPGPGVGVGVHTNPHIRHSTMSLNAMHLRASGNAFQPILLPPPGQAEVDTEKMRSLRSVTVRPQRPHSIAGGIDFVEDHRNGETTRSLRSFSMAAGEEDDSIAEQLQGTGENVRSLRSFIVRPGGAVLSLAPVDNSETTRSLCSFSVRPQGSEKAMSDTSSDNGENERSEGTVQTGSTSSLVQGNHSEMDENPRSMRSVSVYRN